MPEVQWKESFHYVCKKGQVRGVHGLSEQPELDSDERDDSYESSDYEFLAVIAVEPSIHAIELTSGYAREIYTEMKINNKKIKFQINCRASINIITKCHTTKQNPEDVEWNRNETPQNYLLESHKS